MKANWPRNPEELYDNYVTQGRDCDFYELNGYGYKLFKCEATAALAYKNQRRLAKHGLAPPCSHYQKYDKNFGYITEIAELDDVLEDNYIYENVSDDLAELIKEINGQFDDDLPQNVGIYNDKPVIIDTADHFFEDITKEIEEKYGDWY